MLQKLHAQFFHQFPLFLIDLVHLRKRDARHLLHALQEALQFQFQRKGTPAKRWKDDIPESVKQERLQRLMDLQNEIGNEERQQMLGKTYEVLVERWNRDGKTLKDRTRCWKKVIFEGDSSMIGSLQQVEIHSYSHQTLLGSCLSPLSQLA